MTDSDMDAKREAVRPPRYLARPHRNRLIGYRALAESGCRDRPPRYYWWSAVCGPVPVVIEGKPVVVGGRMVAVIGGGRIRAAAAVPIIVTENIGKEIANTEAASNPRLILDINSSLSGHAGFAAFVAAIVGADCATFSIRCSYGADHLCTNQRHYDLDGVAMTMPGQARRAQ
jgi:hypothetical protein